MESRAGGRAAACTWLPLQDLFPLSCHALGFHLADPSGDRLPRPARDPILAAPPLPAYPGLLAVALPLALAFRVPTMAAPLVYLGSPHLQRIE